MSFNSKKHRDSLLFLPLGGSGEIGMNLNLYYLDGKWLMIDCGAGFAEDYLPGIDMIVPDITFIRERRKDLAGLVLTHAHEDHLGAVQYLWDELECPVYATPFTAAFLKAKLADSKAKFNVPVTEIKPGATFQVGHFDLELAQITHSVPEMNAVMVRTKYGSVFHSGDWKLDPNPVVGAKTDESKLRAYGEEGVLAMVSDSTNVFSAGHSGSEGDLQQSLIDIIGDCRNMIIVTTFASNVARLESIAKAAEAAGRHIIVAGRSIWRIIRAAKQSGYLQDCIPFEEEERIHDYARNQVLVLATGCQGEPLAATNKIVNESHRHIRVKPDDTIIFSSKIIPGNDKRINRLFNRLVKLNVNVMTERDHFVHVSGHPNVEDLKDMYGWVRPKISVPVHGEDVHMQEHVRLAKEWGVEHAIKIENGDIVKLAPGEPAKVASIECMTQAIDGNTLIPEDSPIIKMRRRLQREGIVIISAILDKHGMASEPVVIAPGLLDPKADADVLVAIAEEVTEALDQSFGQSHGKGANKRVDNVIRAAVRRILRSETGKNPPIELMLQWM